MVIGGSEWMSDFRNPASISFFQLRRSNEKQPSHERKREKMCLRNKNDLLNRIETMMAATLLVVLMTQAAFAQTPNIGDAVEQAAPPKKEVSAAKAPEAPVVIEETPPDVLELDEGEKILIKAFKIEDVQEKDWRILQELLAPYRFREMSMGDIAEAADHITLYYRNRGFMIAQTYVPKQDATHGELTFKVLFGQYGKILVRNESAIRDSVVLGVFENARMKSPTVTRAELERAMLLVREMPGGRIPMVSISAGEKTGTSNFLLELESSPRFGGYVMADNQGSRHTGEYRVYGGGEVNSLFGLADKFSVSYMTTDTTDLNSARAAYEFPLAHNGLRGEASYSRTRYELGGAYSALGATGKADIAEGRIVYPIVKQRAETIDVFGKVTYKRMTDDISLGDMKNPRNSTTMTLGLERTAYGSIGGRGLYTKLTGGLDFGDLNINDPIQSVVDEAGPDTSGVFSKLNLDATGELGLVGELSARGTLRFQKVVAGGNVDSTEQFFISGVGGVRAFTESVGFDNGFVFTGELRYALPGVGALRHTLNLFVDNGRAWAASGDYATIDEFRLTDAGSGYSVSYRWFFGTAQVAIPVTLSNGLSNSGTRVLFQAGIAF